jgi:predicted Zn-dependent peptidase
MIVSIVGNTDINKIKNYLENIKSKNIKLNLSPKKPIIEKRNSQKVYFRKGIDQAHVTLGIHCPTLASKEKYALEVFNIILGGGMSSRLFQEVREKRGLVYAIKSFIDVEKSYGSLIVYAGTEKKKVKEVKEITLKVLKSIEKINPSDFEQAKEQCLGLNKVINEKSDYVAKDLFFNEIASDAKEHYLYEQKINQVKIKDIKKFSKINGYGFTALIPK